MPIGYSDSISIQTRILSEIDMSIPCGAETRETQRAIYSEYQAIS